jgi:hypothetical protein
MTYYHLQCPLIKCGKQFEDAELWREHTIWHLHIVTKNLDSIIEALDEALGTKKKGKLEWQAPTPTEPS